MSNLCRFTIPASRDLEEILDYIAAKSGVSSAEYFLVKINQIVSGYRDLKKLFEE